MGASSSEEEEDEYARRELTLTNRGFEKIPEEVFKYTQLECLSLDGNKLDVINDDIATLKSLKKFSGSYNKISKIPNSLLQLSLTHLTLNKNEILEIPEKFGEISSLEVLHLERNNIEILPKSFSNLKNLKSLYLDDNNLKKFPEEILHLINLNILNLSGNRQISEIPAGISNLVNLKQLWASHMGLQSIPIELSSLPKLAYLDLSTNQISELPAEFGTNCSELQTLILSYNLFDEFPEEILKIKKLSFIDLRGNIMEFFNCKELENFKGCKRTETIQPDLILDDLFLGSIETTQSLHGLQQLGISHVLSICYENIVRFSDITYKQLSITDIAEENIRKHFHESIQFINDAITGGGKVLVHCNRGVSRSSTIVIAYVMNHKKIGKEEALSFVKQKRDVILPNRGFLEQLGQFESDLKFQ